MHVSEFYNWFVFYSSSLFWSNLSDFLFSSHQLSEYWRVVLDSMNSSAEVFNAHPENEDDKQTGLKLTSKKVSLCRLCVDLYK